MPAPVLYSAVFDRPDLIQQGRTELLVCRTYRDGAIATPTVHASSIVTVVDENDEEVVEAAVALAGGFAVYSLAGAATEDLQRSNRWKVRWALLMPDGIVHRFENRAALCRSVPHPSISERTLYARVNALDPKDPACISKRKSYTDTIEEAWNQVANRLIEDELAIERVLSPAAMREVLVTLTLAMVFEDLATYLNTAGTNAASYRDQYEAAWGKLAPEVDEDDDGNAEGSKPASAPVFVG